jgi:hypothetical protein
MRTEVSNSCTAFAIATGFVLAFVAMYATNLHVSKLDCLPSALQKPAHTSLRALRLRHVSSPVNSPSRSISSLQDTVNAPLEPTRLQISLQSDHGKQEHGKNWTVVRWFDASPSPEELTKLLPELNKRNARLMYSYNEQSDQWSECLISWKEGTWQHAAMLKLRNHAERATRANKSADVIKVLGFRWGFGSGVTSLSRSIVHAVVKDQPVCI